jgi:type IV secretion system protein VirD4
VGQEVHVLDLRDETPVPGSLSPLDLAARCGTDPAATARSFATQIIERGFQTDLFWDNFAETMVAGAVVYLMADAKPEERCMGTVFDLFNADDVTYSLPALLDGTVKGKAKVNNRAARAAFASFLNLPDRETQPGVLGTVQSHLRLFDSELTRRLTDTSSMDIDALIAGEPMTLYIIVPPFRLQASRPLLRMWLSGPILTMTRARRSPRNAR